MNVSWWDESLRLGMPLVLEPEWMKTEQSGAGQGFFNLAHNVASWGQTWGDDGMTGTGLPFAPFVSAYRALEPRHQVHITDRSAAAPKRDGQPCLICLHGISLEPRHQVHITDRSAAALKRDGHPCALCLHLISLVSGAPIAGQVGGEPYEQPADGLLQRGGLPVLGERMVQLQPGRRRPHSKRWPSPAELKRCSTPVYSCMLVIPCVWCGCTTRSPTGPARSSAASGPSTR